MVMLSNVLAVPARTAALALALSALAAGNAADAATSTGTLAVTVEVVNSCAVDGGNLDFGAYTGGQSSDADATGAIRYLGCGAGTLTFALDGGQSGDTNARQLKNANGKALNYQLFRDQSRTQNFADGNDAMIIQVLIGGSSSVPVYGRIPGGQDVPGGTYTDTVNVTLTF